MVFFAPFVGAAALLSGFVRAVPVPDSSINEPAVSASNGVTVTATSSSTASSTGYPSSSSGSGSSYGSGSYNSGSGSYNSGSGSYDSGSGSYGSESGYDSSSNSYGSGSSNSHGSSYGSGSDSHGSDSSWTPASSYSTPSYGSGSYSSGGSSWGSSSGSSGYDSCVQQCVASYGAPPSTYQATPTSGSSDSYGSSGGSGSSDGSGSSGSGATHTVIVAPTQGVLRYVPFALNASVGDTIMFMWGANNHTVTKSSELELCNKSAAPLFASGEQNKGFTFTQVVNDTNPTFFYCGTPTHCEKGMFGIINPPNAFGAPTSVGQSVPAMAASDSGIAAMMAYTNMQTADNTAAASWGSNLDMSGLPSWSYPYIAENTMYTRTFLAANPETLNADGSVNLGGSTPLMVPQDITSAINNAANASSTSTAGSSSSTSTTSASAASTSATAHSGASSMASPSVLMSLMAVAIAFFAL